MAEKKKFNVFQCVQRFYGGNGVDEKTPSKTYVGTTYATTEKSAVNNIAFRTGLSRVHEVPMYGDGVAKYWLVAEEAV